MLNFIFQEKLTGVMAPEFFTVWKSACYPCTWMTIRFAVIILVSHVLFLKTLQTLSSFFSDTENCHEWLKSDLVFPTFKWLASSARSLKNYFSPQYKLTKMHVGVSHSATIFVGIQYVILKCRFILICSYVFKSSFLMFYLSINRVTTSAMSKVLPSHLY